MQTDPFTQFIEIPSNPDALLRTVMITGIDAANRQITISLSGGSDIHMEPPNDEGNQFSIQPVMETPGVALYDLQFEIHESLQGQWIFNSPAAQFFVNDVPAGVLFNSSNNISVTVPIYTNLPQEPNNHARYKVGLGFLEFGSDTPVWIGDPTIILKPPTGGEGLIQDRSSSRNSGRARSGSNQGKENKRF